VDTATSEQQQDGRGDFDFLIGRWNVQHRRLRERLKGSTTWDEFAGTSLTRKTLSGLGNLEEVTMFLPSGRVEAMAFRFFDPQADQWSIYWADSVHGFQPPPVIGEFTEGHGEFYAQDTLVGRSIFCRFIWSDITVTTCRWEQAFSPDGGKSWETNWIMEFTRQREEKSADTP
jgi:hypothetical protein